MFKICFFYIYLLEDSKTVEKVNSYEADFEKLSDKEIKAKTIEFRERIEKGH